MVTFGRYRLHRRLAVGGMAEIFVARSASIDGFEKTLVIKKIRPDLSSDEQFFSMFIDEARISITMSHPNVVQVFDFGKAEDSYYLAMEYVRGCDVGSLMQLEPFVAKPLPTGLSLYIIEEALKGLDYAHKLTGSNNEPLHVVHRDVSPANLLLSYDGAVKIVDFGIAEARGRITRTEPGMVMGKLSYMSPEHATGQVVDRRTDVFSCGIVLWEMLTGRSPYGSKLDEKFYDRIRDADLSPPSKINPTITPALDAVVMRALARDPKDRYASARGFGHALHSHLVQYFPEISVYTLQAFLEKHRAELRELAEYDEDSVLDASLPNPPAPVAGDADTQLLLATPKRAEFDWSPKLIKVVESFRKHPNLWTLVGMGDACEKSNQRAAALGAYRVAAVRFAQAGLLSQCLMCCQRMLAQLDYTELRAEFAAMPSHEGRSDAELASAMFKTDGPMEDLLREIIGDSTPRTGAQGEGTPLLSYLGGDAFAELVRTAAIRSFDAGTNVIEQGAAGRTMFLICRGRVLIYATTFEGRRIYLSSLTAGDFLGENSFFTGAPRSATVEALYDVDAVEIDRALYDRIMRGNDRASEVLLQFYKDRIVETVMATSPTFGLLPNEDRRELVKCFRLRRFEPGTMLIREGETSEQIYLFKSGEAEVFTEKGGPRTVFSSIGPGTIVGEVAALRHIPRTASVQATTRVEVLELPGSEFDRVLQSRPEVKAKILDVVARRARENMDKVMGPSPFARNLD